MYRYTAPGVPAPLKPSSSNTVSYVMTKRLPESDVKTGVAYPSATRTFWSVRMVTCPASEVWSSAMKSSAMRTRAP